MAAASPQDACRQLTAAANAAGGRDNITTIIVQMETAGMMPWRGRRIACAACGTVDGSRCALLSRLRPALSPLRADRVSLPPVRVRECAWHSLLRNMRHGLARAAVSDRQ